MRLPLFVRPQSGAPAPSATAFEPQGTLYARRAVWPALVAALLLCIAAQPRNATADADAVDAQARDRAEVNAQSGHDALNEGRYPAAVRFYRRVLRAVEDEPRLLSEPQLARVVVGLARSDAERGAYDDALATYREWLPRWQDGAAGLWPMALSAAELMVELGQLEPAAAIAAAVRERDETNAHALLIGARIHYERGERDEAQAVLQRAIDGDGAQREALADSAWLHGRHLVAIGQSWYYLDLIRRRSTMQQALRAFQQARTIDPSNYDAWVWGGHLSLEAQQQADARIRWYKPVLDRNPNYIPARAGFSRTYYFEWQSFRGREEAVACLRIAPDHLDTKLVMAEANIRDQRYDLAVPFIEGVLERNPRHLEALSVRALLHLYAGERDAFRAVEARVLERNASYSSFYAVVAEGLMQQHRFREALELGAKGLELDERDWTIHTTLGMTHARMGNMEAANRYLVAANRNDALRNSLYTLNMLQALRVVNESFRTRTTDDGRFVIRTHANEAGWLMPLVERHLQEAWESQSAKYGFEPEGPIVVEVFHRRDDFAARSIALPALPALGVCFGQYITMLSPTAMAPGSFSWARTLRHEMDHIYQIQASGGRVPRWLAEGCSVYEERITRPEWTRQMEQQMIQFYHQDRLLRLATINAGFRTMGSIMFAYYQSSYMVEFIVEELHDNDYSPIVRMLRLFGEDRSIVDVVAEVLGMTLEEFDDRFREFVRQRFIEPNEVMAYYGPDDLQRFRLAYEDNPEDADLCAKLAAALLHNGATADARNFAGRALRLQEDHPLANLVWAHVLFQNAAGSGDAGAMARAERAYRRCVELNVADFWVYLRLAQIATQRNDLERATAMFETAQRMFPAYVGPGNPYLALAELYRQQGRGEDARRQVEAYVRIVETDVEHRRMLRRDYLARGNRPAALRMLEEIVNVGPADPNLHVELAADYLALRQFDDAAFAYRVALGFRDDVPRDLAATGLIEALRLAGRYEEALQEIADRQRTEPDRFRWRRLRERVEATRDGRELPTHPDGEEPFVMDPPSD